VARCESRQRQRTDFTLGYLAVMLEKSVRQARRERLDTSPVPCDDINGANIQRIDVDQRKFMGSLG
jgi:hypothetical protein